ncbi:MAG: family 20 glycosylhydrolase, partial [Bryobacteraceae bacterium]
GYIARVNATAAVVAGFDDRGAFYGLQTLRQLITRRGDRLEIRGAEIEDRPHKPFRGVKVFLPGVENLAFFKRFLRDFMALYKYNTVIIEMNAAMRLDRHPELNAGWIEFAKAINYSRRNRPRGPGMQFQDSAHHDTGDGYVLEKSDVAELVRFAREHYIDVIPEIPTLTHSYYLLTRHRELAEIGNAEWPDTYCPSNPASYALVFDVLDEYAEVMRPYIMHVGHDEWRMPTHVCPRCKGKDHTELFLADLLRIYGHLKARGINVAIWGDHLIESLRGAGKLAQVSPSGFRYEMPGALSERQVVDRFPKDILIFNWFWRDWGPPGEAVKAGAKLVDWGLRQVFGNMRPEFADYVNRSAAKGVLGGAPSSWAATTEFNIGKDQLFDFLGCANLLWSKQWPEPSRLAVIVQEMMPAVRRNLSGVSLPSEDGLASASVAIEKTAMQVDGEGPPIAINEDVSSLVFVHASAKPAGNAKVDTYVYNAPDTADLLGWYEVAYQDGFVETIPLRYGVNILNRGWPGEPGSARYVYQGRVLSCDGACFAHEWVNPRFGKAVREIRLKTTRGFTDVRGAPIPPNPITLYALSKVAARAAPDNPSLPVTKQP